MSLPWFTSDSTRSSRRRTQPHITVTIPSSGSSRAKRNVSGVSYDKLDELDVASDEEEIEKQHSLNVNNETAVEATGSDIPPPAQSFAAMRFSSRALNDNIKRCRYVNPTAIQKYAIPVAMAGRDLMACAQTGSGKTAAFCFPIIDGILLYKQQNRFLRNAENGVGMACPLALILAPTRELSCQIFEETKKFSHQTGVKVVVAYGGTPIFQQLRNLEKGVDILVATPGRLLDILERSKASLRNVKYLALDEADRMLDMGFERDVRKIVQQMGMPPPGSRQTLLFSATFPAEIRKLGSDFLSSYIFLSAGKVGSSANLIVQRVEFVSDLNKRDHLVNLLCSQRTNILTHAKDALTLVFVETKKGADALEHWLSKKGFSSIAIHGDKVQIERERALRSFKNGHTPIMVATDVAARGLDIPDVAHVINFDLPKVIEGYVHRIGRTGRAGKSGLATAFFSEKNMPLAKELVELMQEANQHIPKWLREYAKTSHNGGGNSRASRYGGIKFRGHGYGNGSGVYENFHNDDYSSQYGDNPVSSNPYASTFDAAVYNDSYSAISGPTPCNSADHHCNPNPNSYGAESYYDSSTASGWD